MQPKRFRNGRFWNLLSFRIIFWTFLDEINYADKNDQKKIDWKNNYYPIVTLEHVRA